MGCPNAYVYLRLQTLDARSLPFAPQTIAAIGQPFPGTLDGKARTIIGSTGLLLPGLEARTVREDGTEADVNEPGELWLRGGNIALGYWNNDSATKSTFIDGWLHTGDSFRITEDHYFL